MLATCVFITLHFCIGKGESGALKLGRVASFLGRRSVLMDSYRSYEIGEVFGLAYVKFWYSDLAFILPSRLELSLRLSNCACMSR